MQFFKVKKWLKEQRKPHQLTDQRFSVRFSSSFSPRNENSNLHLELAENPSGLTRLAVLSFLEGSSDIFGRPVARSSWGVVCYRWVGRSSSMAPAHRQASPIETTSLVVCFECLFPETKSTSNNLSQQKPKPPCTPPTSPRYLPFIPLRSNSKAVMVVQYIPKIFFCTCSTLTCSPKLPGL